MSTLPSWASPETYEYDLGMQTVCFQCGKALVEGQKVYRDIEEGEQWKAQGFLGMSGALYCSEQCVKWVSEPPVCEWCGEPNEFLDEVDDSDPSVGYRSMLLMCPACRMRRRLEPTIKVLAPAPGDTDPFDDIVDQLLDGQDAGLTPRSEP